MAVRSRGESQCFAGALLTGLHRNDIRKDPQWFLAQLRKLNEYQRQTCETLRRDTLEDMQAGFDRLNFDSKNLTPVKCNLSKRCEQSK